MGKHEKIIKKNPSFWDIKNYLPAETNAYVMNFIALSVLFNNYDNFIKKALNFNIEPKSGNTLLDYLEDITLNKSFKNDSLIDKNTIVPIK